MNCLIYNGEVTILSKGGKKTNVHNGHTVGECWQCGKKGKTTRHHVLNKSWHPKHNIVIPLCRDCHDKVHNRAHPVIHNSNRRIKYSVREDNPDGSFKTYTYYKFPENMKIPKMFNKDRMKLSNWVRI